MMGIEDVPCGACVEGYSGPHDCDVPEFCPCDQTVFHTKPPPEGWYPFGWHVADRVLLEFSEQIGEDGLPLWERPIPKPVIEGHVQEFRSWGDPKPLRISTKWTVRCPCNRDRYLAAVGTWEGALQIALLHGRTFHEPV